MNWVSSEIAAKINPSFLADPLLQPTKEKVERLNTLHMTADEHWRGQLKAETAKVANLERKVEIERAELEMAMTARLEEQQSAMMEKLEEQKPAMIMMKRLEERKTAMKVEQERQEKAMKADYERHEKVTKTDEKRHEEAMKADQEKQKATTTTLAEQQSIIDKKLSDLAKETREEYLVHGVYLNFSFLYH